MGGMSLAYVLCIAPVRDRWALGLGCFFSVGWIPGGPGRIGLGEGAVRDMRYGTPIEPIRVTDTL